MQTSRSRRSPQRCEELDALRECLPAYWWDEVRRVRALIAVDAACALREADHFDYAAQAIAQACPSDRDQLDALTIASVQLKAIARSQIARA